eukprot:COSAG04_NODE_6158_length_1395_cov_2.679012_2_plen_369_part_01
MGGGSSKTEVLQRFDANGDGQLDAAEQAQLVDAAASAGADRASTERLLAAADTNEDGTIDAGELEALGKSADALGKLGAPEQNQALTQENQVLTLTRENEELRTRLAQTEQKLRECERKLAAALRKGEPEPEPASAPSAETRPEPQPKGPEGYKPGALRDAVMAGELSTVNELLDAGVDPNSPRERLADWTPLHYAAQLGHTEIIDALLTHEAEPRPRDRDGQTPLMQTGYWGRVEAKELLLRRGGGEESEVPPKMIMVEEFGSKIGRWNAEGTVTIICSAPEFSLPYKDGTKDNVMKALFGLCDMNYKHVKFGYDWAGSSTAEPADTDANRLVPECCLSLACSCGDHRSTVMIKGPVQWWNPKSVAGS